METIARNQATVAQIQRLEDADANSFTGKAWPKNHGDILKGRRTLRVYGRFEEILDVYHKNQVFRLSGETGSGKSTQVPQMLVFDEFASGLRIICTQPRRLAATALADRVAEEMGVALGEEVGFQIGGQIMSQHPNDHPYSGNGSDICRQTRQKVKPFTRDKDLSQYACIIIDEAHERTVEADILMAMLKKIIQHRKDLKDYSNKCPGVCYRLYSKDFDHMALSTQPAIHRKPFHSTALHLLAFGYSKIVDFDWINSPHPETIARAVQDLQDWSGCLAQQFTLDPSWYRSIEVGVELGCSIDIVDIALVCSSQKSIFTTKPHFQELADLSQMAFAAYPSDHLALLNAFGLYLRAFENKDDTNFSLQEWCALHFLYMQTLEEIRRKRQELGSILKNVAKLPPTRASIREPWRVQKALAIAFCNQTAIFHATPDEYRTVHENVATRLPPLSSLLGGNYEWVVYTNFISSGGKVYIDIVTPIEAEWLLDLPYFAAERLPLKGDGSFRQGMVKQSLDAAKAGIEASKHK
ncbi:hypothetical protein N3K66_003751 [Trichothecium roseum]|uniref:Uncharacterized protein n=1 Tax=Trichothecium roseum TaxID=47278 RepID=A0ACC0V7V3_9HYPO|nr:hypothetical protein N3K66_003751 [Trichothecium roseum]